MKNAASRPRQVIAFLIQNFKQPHFGILAAQSVRGLLLREPREGMERREGARVQ
jgi:hypothetical protein